MGIALRFLNCGQALSPFATLRTPRWAVLIITCEEWQTLLSVSQQDDSESSSAWEHR
jgi:hypothetical protein